MKVKIIILASLLVACFILVAAIPRVPITGKRLHQEFPGNSWACLICTATNATELGTINAPVWSCDGCSVLFVDPTMFNVTNRFAVILNNKPIR
jgi:ribosomal protein L37AE/L43A